MLIMLHGGPTGSPDINHVGTPYVERRNLSIEMGMLAPQQPRSAGLTGKKIIQTETPPKTVRTFVRPFKPALLNG